MHRKTKAVSLVCLAVALLCLELGGLPIRSQAHQSMSQPTSTPVPPSNAQRALSHLSQAAHIPVEQLLLVNESVQELPLTGRALWRGLILDRVGEGKPLYEVLMEAQGEDPLNSAQVEALWGAERAAYRATYGEQVLERVAQRAGVPLTRLQITNDVLENYPLTGIVFWRVKLLDVETGKPYHLDLGPGGAELDPEALRQAELEARRARYGRLDPELYYRLQAMDPEEPAPVLAWLSGVDYEWVDAQLAARYPALVAEFRFAGGQALQENGSPIHLEPELFEQAQADYNDLLDQAHLAAAQPVVDFLQARGYEAQAFESFPGVYAELPAIAVIELNETPPANLATIYWGAITFQEHWTRPLQPSAPPRCGIATFATGAAAQAQGSRLAS